MCGIGGIVNFNSSTVEKEQLKVISSFIQERGPENTGFYQFQNIGFCHTRLSILDLSSSAHQPMQHENLIITYNGEIYNFKLLKKELIGLGWSFNTNSDTEVILHGFKAWGLNSLLEKLDGMFAFSIFDKNVKKVFCCRDRFGKKPLYYFLDSKTFMFCSDIRAIHQLCKSRLSLDWESLDYYFAELSAPQPKTIWNEVKQVEQSTYLEIDLDSGTKKIEQYWKINYRDKQNLDYSEALSITEERLVKAVVKRTVSDVPIGCFLSGGVDSGLITAILASNSDQKINTFSVGVTDEAMNELPLARVIAEKYGTNHHELIVETDVVDILPDLINYFGEPFADSSFIPTYLISKAISTNFKVALSGDGGDEIFGGYDDYAVAYNADKYFAQKRSGLNRKIKTTLSKVGSRISPSVINLGLYDAYQKSDGSYKLSRQMGFNSEERRYLFCKDVQTQNKNFTDNYFNSLWDKYSTESNFETLSRASLDTRLINDYLVKVDRASMNSSLEIRSPFLDKDLAEFAFSLHSDIKLKDGNSKSLLKSLGKKYLTNEIISRKKTGFGIPIHSWIKDAHKEFIKDQIFCNPDLFKILNKPFISKILEDHYSGKANNQHKIWAVMCFSIWLQEFK